MQNENSTNTLYKCPFLSSDFDTENIVELNNFQSHICIHKPREDL